MKAKELLAALALPLAIADSRMGGTTNHILGHIKIAGGKAAAFNWREAVEVDLPGLDLGCCVPAQRLNSALTAIAAFGGEAELKISLAGRSLTITAPRARYRMPTLAADDLPSPQWPTDPKPVNDWKALASALRFTVQACAANDAGRPFAGGIGTQAGYLAGTDGHRAAVVRDLGELADKLLLPMQAVPVFAGLSNVKTWSSSETGFAVDFDGGRLHVQQIAASYPDVGRVVPEKHPVDTIDVEREALLGAVTAILRTKTQTLVTFSATRDRLVIEDDSQSSGESARVEVECVNRGADWSDGINIAFLADACRELDGKSVEISFTDKRFMFTGAAARRSVVIMAAKV